MFNSSSGFIQGARLMSSGFPSASGSDMGTRGSPLGDPDNSLPSNNEARGRKGDPSGGVLVTGAFAAGGILKAEGERHVALMLLEPAVLLLEPAVLLLVLKEATLHVPLLGALAPDDVRQCMPADDGVGDASSLPKDAAKLAAGECS